MIKILICLRYLGISCYDPDYVRFYKQSGADIFIFFRS